MSKALKMYHVVFNAETRPQPAGSTPHPTTGRSADYPLAVIASSFGEAEKAADKWKTDNSSNTLIYKEINYIKQINTGFILAE